MLALQVTGHRSCRIAVYPGGITEHCHVVKLGFALGTTVTNDITGDTAAAVASRVASRINVSHVRLKTSPKHIMESMESVGNVRQRVHI